MSVTRWLAVSVVANVTLIGYVALRHTQFSEPVQSIEMPAHASASGNVVAPRVASASPHFDPDKALALSRLEQEARDANPPPSIEYWRATDDVELAKYEEVVEQQREAMRQQLFAQYGPTASEDPAFNRLFKPLNVTHAYLSSRGQIALARLQRAKRASTYASLGRAPAALVANRDVVLEQQRTFEAEVRRVLGDEYAEYQLRHSPLARQLRGMSIIESEREFRDVHAALEQLGRVASPEVYTRVQGQLRTLLGETRFARFSAARDPGFPAIEAAGARAQLSREQILAAYSVIVRAQDELIATSIRQSTGGASLPRQEVQQILDGRHEEIARLVGDSAATVLLQAHSNGMSAAGFQAMNNAP